MFTKGPFPMTIKKKKIHTHKIIAVIILKFEQCSLIIQKCIQMENRVDPDQTYSEGAV